MTWSRNLEQEVWSSNPVDYSKLRIFGCLVFAHVNNRKLTPKAVKYMFLGYVSKSKGYRWWCCDSKNVIPSRDVTFNENAMLSFEKESIASSTGTSDQEDASRRVGIEVETGVTQGGVYNNSSRDVQAPTSPNQSQVNDDYSIAHDHPRTEIRKPARYIGSEGLVDYAFIAAGEIVVNKAHTSENSTDMHTKPLPISKF